MMLPVAEAFDVEGVKRRLGEAGGGYEVVHDSPGLELGVYVLVAPEPDRQQPHADDEVYVVLEGTIVLEVEGTHIELREGNAVFRAGRSRASLQRLRASVRPRDLRAAARVTTAPTATGRAARELLTAV
jgi:hypothetical protein